MAEIFLTKFGDKSEFCHFLLTEITYRIILDYKSLKTTHKNIVLKRNINL